MKITWIGHSCFKIEKSNFVMIVDPYEDGSVPGLAPVREKANLVLCSHEHGDHNYRDGVTLQEGTVNPFKVKVISTYHDEVRGAKRGLNQIFILDDGENRIAHLGDLGCELEPEQVEELKDLDAVFIPVGGYYTIDGSQAAKLVKRLKPRMVIPMHYRSDADGFGFDVIEGVDRFIAELGSAAHLLSSELETAQQFAEQVVVLQPANRNRRV